MTEAPAEYIAVADVERLLKEDGAAMLIDARSPEEYAEAHVPGAINVPIADLPDFARSGDTGKGPLATMCGSTGRGEKAAAILEANGVENVRVMEGGLKAWREAGLPIAP